MDYFGTHETAIGKIIANWHRKQHRGTAFVPPFSAMAWIDEEGRFFGSAVFCNYTKYNIDIHLVIKKPRVRMRGDIYRYVFDQLQCLRLTATVPVTNHRVLRLAQGLGFHLEGSLPHYFGPGEKGVILGLYAGDDDVKGVIDVRRPERAKHSVLHASGISAAGA